MTSTANMTAVFFKFFNIVQRSPPYKHRLFLPAQRESGAEWLNPP